MYNLEELARVFRKRFEAQQTVLADQLGMVMDLTLAELAGILFDAVGDAPLTAAEDGGEWQAGLKYAAGMTVYYDGKSYRVVQAHLSQENWRPDAPGVYLFEVIVEKGAAWAENVYYNQGDLVTRDGKTFECVTQHLSQAGWYPGAPGVYLWREVTE